MKSKVTPPAPRSYWRLYLSRFLGTWGDRWWWFACGMFVFWLKPTDLKYCAYLGLAQDLSKVLLGSYVGSWIDKTERMLAVKVFVFAQNFCITAACTLVAFFFFEKNNEYNPDLFAGIVIGLAAVSEVAALGNKIVVERDWVVQISSTEDDLARMNMIFQTIDLASKTLAPVFVGLLLELTGICITAIVLVVWNVTSGVLEYILMSMIFKEYPTLLKEKKELNESEKASSLLSKISGAFQGWKLYMTHPTRNAGLCLAVLYMTVLAFGNVLWAYCLLQCVKEYLLSILVAFAAINGILGSMAFPCLRNRVGVECAGQIGLLALLTALSACVLSVFLAGSPWDMRDRVIHTVRSFRSSTKTGVESWMANNVSQGEVADPKICPTQTSVHVLLAGIVAGRFGLWLTDIAITQIQQQEIVERNRGKIGGVQNALNSMFSFLNYALVLIFPQVSRFGYLVFASYISVCCGALLYTTYARCGCRNSARSADTAGTGKRENTVSKNPDAPLLMSPLDGNPSSMPPTRNTYINGDTQTI